ncbi:hypothetical protein BDY19DRAFT_994221 [Irpex rosettiformis]|uniref:Uncharacterized protein n=1 Tax=Irpex rosettiformis TaxID=378272 RepID=A0ACB8U253_9APHY|nr:hypothetical protein BDY19DRAFT_994221 [Irpex rosettiformis]
MTAVKSEGGFKPSPATPDERSKIEQIVEIMCGACDPDRVLTFLRRNGGSVDKTITALFDAPDDDAPTTSGSTELSELRAAASSVVLSHTPWTSQAPSQTGTAPCIDLTDDDLNRALQASLQDQGSTFGPSDRAPDPSWAVVPSNVAVSATTNNLMSQDDQDLNQAIEASLNHEMSTDPIEDRPLEDRVRVGESPVALCPTYAPYTYASNIIHALYFVPQVRDYIAPWRPLSDDPSLPSRPPTGGPGLTVWTLLETFVNMELSRMNELCPDKALAACSTIPWDNPSRTPGELTYEFYTNVAWQVEAILNAELATQYPEPPPWPRSDQADLSTTSTTSTHPPPSTIRLFHLRHGKDDIPPFRGPFNREYDASAVRVTVRNDLEPTDLVSCLAAELVDDFKPNTNIVEASEVMAFELLREPKPPGERQRFSYPASVYLDQFLRENSALASERRKMRKAALEEVARLQSSKFALLKHKGRDTLADLRSAVYYFENIAEDADDDARRDILADTAVKLGKIIVKIEDEVKHIDDAIEALKLEAVQALDCPELQKHKYDLRAVLVHDGLYGRNHLYSYVKFKNVWWKTVEYKVTEVSEGDVLNDPVGFHLGAGPYFLIYSRAISVEEENACYPWPIYLKDTVKQNNKTFFDQLPEHISNTVVDPNSPATSYATPIEELLPSELQIEVVPMEVDQNDLPSYAP